MLAKVDTQISGTGGKSLGKIKMNVFHCKDIILTINAMPSIGVNSKLSCTLRYYLF